MPDGGELVTATVSSTLGSSRIQRQTEPDQEFQSVSGVFPPAPNLQMSLTNSTCAQLTIDPLYSCTRSGVRRQ